MVGQSFFPSWSSHIAGLAISLFILPAFAQANNAGNDPVPAVDCVINPNRVADVSSPIPGIVDQLLVQRSEQVRKGQPIAHMNAEVEQANVELARYRADIASELELGKINVEFDANRMERSKSLSQRQAIAVELVDEVEREFRLSRQRLVQAQELARVRHLELQRAEEQLNQKTIKAPFDGFIIDTLKQPGERVEEDAILRMAELNPLVVEAIVPMEYFRDIKLNMRAKIVPETLVNEQLDAVVSIIDRVGDTASNTFGVRLELDNPDYRIPAGLKCTVKFLKTTSASAPVQGTSTYYLVTTEQAESHDKTRTLINRLRAAGVADPLTMDRGPHSGTILLGLFNSLGNAERQRMFLEKQGFQVSLNRGA